MHLAYKQAILLKFELPPLVEGNRNGQENVWHCRTRSRHSDSGGIPVRRQLRDRRQSRFWVRADHRLHRGGNCNGCWIIPYGPSQIDHPNVVAAEIRIRAERKTGQLLKDSEKAKGTRLKSGVVYYETERIGNYLYRGKQ